jgi:hypothetical protein
MHFNNIPFILSLVPLIFGAIWTFSNGSSTVRKSVGLTLIGALAGGLIYIRFSIETEPSILFLASAVLLSGFCSLLCQEDSQEASPIYASVMIALGFGFGVLLNEAIMGRIFLCGLLGYVAYSLNQEQQKTFRTKIILLHIVFAITFALSSVFMGETSQMLAGLFLALTFLPLAPFHLPFVRTIKDAKGTLSSFWIVVWLMIGLGELKTIYSFLTAEILFVLSLLAILSAIYASLASLGQKVNSLFVASATLAHSSLIWGLLQVFTSFPKWGIPFGITLALVMGGIALAFSFVQMRYGWKTIGNLPGLLSTMPRLGVVIVLLVSFALFLPLFPAYSGLGLMPTIETQDVGIVMISLLFSVVWLGGGWYFIKMLHQTAFGEARTDVPYFDLGPKEVFSISVLILAAAYSGIIL